VILQERLIFRTLGVDYPYCLQVARWSCRDSALAYVVHDKAERVDLAMQYGDWIIVTGRQFGKESLACDYTEAKSP
jgi:hypothetical protein